MIQHTFSDELCAAHLAGMVRFPTESHAEDSLTDYEPFFALHRYLEETYPLIHRNLKKEVIGKAGLLYTWKGKKEPGEAPLPVLLTAHLDVVPAGDWEKWEVPPYEGIIKEGKVIGRGSLDCKSNLMAIMEAVEALLAEGFQPDYDLYLGFGCNEEVSSSGDVSCARKICRTLQERGVKLGFVIDEGAGVHPDFMDGASDLVCDVWLSEKGYADFEISITDKGGHSMAPGKRSVLGELGQICADIAGQPYPYRVIPAVAAEYRAKAHLLPANQKILAEAEQHLEEVTPLLDANPFLASKFQTTTALTMISGSPQANILPTEAKLTVNCRPLEGDSIQSMQARLEKIVNGRAKVRLIRGVEPSPTSRIDTPAYACIEKVTKEMYPGVLMVPSLMTGGTDAKNYYPICDCVYRMSGYCVEVKVLAHTYNEYFPVKNCHSGAAWFFALLQEYTDVKNEL